MTDIQKTYSTLTNLRKASFEVRKHFPPVFRFVKSKTHFVAVKNLMSIVARFEFSISSFHLELQNFYLHQERTEKRYSAVIFERHYFLYLETWCISHNTCGHQVTTKFSRLDGFTMFS